MRSLVPGQTGGAGSAGQQLCIDRGHQGMGRGVSGGCDRYLEVRFCHNEYGLLLEALATLYFDLGALYPRHEML